MQHGDLLACVLFSGDAGGRLGLQRTGRFDRNLSLVECLHNSVTSGLVALLAFLVGVGANLIDESFRRRSACAGDTGGDRNCHGRSDRAIAEVVMGSKSSWHVRIVSRISMLVQARFEMGLAR